MDNPADELADIFKAWNRGNANATLRDFRTEVAKKRELDLRTHLGHAMALLAGCQDAISQLDAAHRRVDHYRVAQPAWVDAIVMPKIKWDDARTAAQKCITPESLGLLEALGGQIDDFGRGFGIRDETAAALRTLCADVEALLEAHEVDPRLAEFLRGLVAAVRSALDAKDPHLAVARARDLLAQMSLWGEAAAREGKPWGQALRDLAVGSLGGLLSTGVYESAQAALLQITP